MKKNLFISFYGIHTYEYDSKNNLISSSCDGWETFTYEYDESNRPIKCYHDCIMSSNPILLELREDDYIETITYDENGKGYSTMHYLKTSNQNEEIVDMGEVVSDWNPKNNIIDGIELPENTSFKYDKKGNWIEVITYDENGLPEYIIERKIEY